MKKQTEINESMRAILVDWLIDVHAKFKLLPETLYLTINLIDRFLTKTQGQKSKLQLVGVAALMIATKFEEIYPPTLKDLVYLTDRSYNEREIISMEYQMLTALDFDLQLTSPYRFLERYSKLSKLDSVELNLTNYILELSLLDSKMNQFVPSLLAASAIATALTYQRPEVDWEKIEEATGFTQEQIKGCMKCQKILI